MTLKPHVSPISILITSPLLLLLFMLIIPIDIDFYYNFLRSSIDFSCTRKKISATRDRISKRDF